MVVMKDGVNEFSANRSSKHDLPTPLSPISSSLMSWSYSLALFVFAVEAIVVVFFLSSLSRSYIFDGRWFARSLP